MFAQSSRRPRLLLYPMQRSATAFVRFDDRVENIHSVKDGQQGLFVNWVQVTWRAFCARRLFDGPEAES